MRSEFKILRARADSSSAASFKLDADGGLVVRHGFRGRKRYRYGQHRSRCATEHMGSCCLRGSECDLCLVNLARR